MHCCVAAKCYRRFDRVLVSSVSNLNLAASYSHRLQNLSYSNHSNCNVFSSPLLPNSRSDNSSCADVITIPLMADNYCYILIDPLTKQAAIIDPGIAAPVIEVIERLKQNEKYSLINITSILCTHKHDDHVGGNQGLKEYSPNINVIGPSYEFIPYLDCGVRHRDIFFIGSLRVETLFTPCHTSGHVCYFVTRRSGKIGAEDKAVDSSTSDNGCGSDTANSKSNSSYSGDSCSGDGKPVLFSGDTLFAGGCGRFFEGSADQMLANMDLLSSLPARTQIYCGHEYTLSNLKFLRALGVSDPIKSYIDMKHMKAMDLRTHKEQFPTLPTTLSCELSYNLFMKCREKEVQMLMGSLNDPVGTMLKLRQAKNSFS